MKLRGCLLALAIPWLAFAAEQTSPSDRAQRADAHLKMRLEYAASPAYNPYADGLVETRRASAQLLESGEFDKAIAEAEKGLRIDKLNIDLLMTAAAAYRAKGDLRMADELRQRWMSLVDSIVDRRRGDGKSFETAFRVISVDEEYAVLGVFDLVRTQQYLVEHEGSEYDVLTVRAKEAGNEFELYFNVDIPKRWLRRHLTGGQKEGEPNPPLPMPGTHQTTINRRPPGLAGR